MAQAALAPNGHPFRQGFVGYVYVGALKWRVMLRFHLELDGWRGRLWFAESGGTEVWDKDELLGPTPEALLQRARSLPAEELILRFRASYAERRRFLGLRAVTDDLIEHVRALKGPRGEARTPERRLRGSWIHEVLRCGLPGGVALWKTSRFFAMYDFHCGGVSSSGKIAVTGHSGSHAPQSMHSSGWM